MSSIKVLFDHSVRQDAKTAEHGFQFAEAQVLQKTIRYLQPATNTKPPRPDWKQAEIDELPKVAALIRQGRIEAFTTDELYAEWFRVAKYPSLRFTDIFEGCTFDFLPAPFERSKWGLSVDQYTSNEHVIAHCKLLLDLSPERVKRFVAGMRKNPRFSLSLFEEKCLRRLYVFKAICHGIDETHYPDALHLWTAEENRMDIFLTHDRKFINVISRQKVRIHCRVMLPSRFVAEIV